MFHLEEALTNGRPEGLKVFGEWSTIYEGLSSLPSQVQKSWFGFDHYYSDCSFDEALAIVFARHPKTLLDVGGNTGRWATKCVSYDDAVEVTIMDLPQQLEMMRHQTKDLPGAELHRTGIGANSSISDDFSFTFYRENDILFCQTAHISTIIGYFSNYDDKVGTVSYQVHFLSIYIKT